MTPRLLIATGNPKKLDELRRILEESGLGVELLGLADVAPYDEQPETGSTFTENALAKARQAVAHTGLPAVADDSGLAVVALSGMPGVLSARWAGPGRGDEANLRLLLAQLADVPDARRHAAFVCAAALVTPQGAERVVSGRVEGAIVREPRGTNGFGYDPVFMPDGHARTMAELDTDEKDAISHRGRALRALVPHLHAELS